MKEGRDFTTRRDDWSENIILDETRALARFMQSFDMPLQGNGCWNWHDDLSFDKDGYPRFFMRVDKRNYHMRAARVAYTIEHSEAPPPGDDICVLHTCDNEKCVNPAHLYLGDKKQNAKDRAERTGYENCQRGEKHPCNKLTELQVKEIIQRGAAGESSVYIMKVMKLKVSRPTVIAIVAGRTWKQLGKRKTPTQMQRERVEKVLQFHKVGWSDEVIAKRVKLGLRWVQEIIRNNGIPKKDRIKK